MTKMKSNDYHFPIVLFILFILVQIQLMGCIDEPQDIDDIIVNVDGTGNYLKIQDAIDNAGINDTIYIKNGIYEEHLIINKTIHLKGENAEKTIIDANGTGHGMIINADDVIIQELTVNNSGSKSTYYEMDAGITINADDIIIRQCISKNNYAGIQIKNTKNNMLDNNILSNNSHGIFLYFSSINIISNNTIVENYDYGCYLYSDANNNVIRDNIFTANRYSLRIKSRDNQVNHNLFKDNRFGIYFCCGSKDNIVYHNSLINNTMYHGKDNFNNNTWYDKDLGGNYWDDYTGVDEDNDGFGDTTYIVDQQDNTKLIAEDILPLISPKIDY